MQTITLQQIPNQAFSVTLDNGKYDIALRTIGDLTYATISRNQQPLVTGVRCVPSRPLIPYEYLEGTGGNFAFVTLNDELPNYQSFNVAHVLVYASNSELTGLRP